MTRTTLQFRIFLTDRKPDGLTGIFNLVLPNGRVAARDISKWRLIPGADKVIEGEMLVIDDPDGDAVFEALAGGLSRKLGSG